jgi:hypothetical protein
MISSEMEITKPNLRHAAQQLFDKNDADAVRSRLQQTTPIARIAPILQASSIPQERWEPPMSQPVFRPELGLDSHARRSASEDKVPTSYRLHSVHEAISVDHSRRRQARCMRHQSVLISGGDLDRAAMLSS